MSSEPDLWRYLDTAFDSWEWERQLKVIADLVRSDINHIQVIQGAKRLAELHSMNARDVGHRKAIGYFVLAAHGNVFLRRIAPAGSILESLRAWPEARAAVDYLEHLIADQFSEKSVSEEKPETRSTPEAPIPENLKASSSDPRPPAQEVVLFSKLSPEEIREVLKTAKVRRLEPGQILFQRGDPAQSFYIVVEGILEMQGMGGPSKVFQAGDFFGEIALLSGLVRTATLRAQTNAELLEFSKEGLITSMAKYPELRQRLHQFYCYRLFLFLAGQNPYLLKASEDDLAQLFFLCTPEEVRPTSVIMAQGSPSTFLIFILRGEVDILRGKEKIGSAGPGSLVGETGLLTRQPRNAAVVARTDCLYLKCPDYAFEHLKKTFSDFHDWANKLMNHRLQGEVLSLME